MDWVRGCHRAVSKTPDGGKLYLASVTPDNSRGDKELHFFRTDFSALPSSEGGGVAFICTHPLDFDEVKDGEVWNYCVLWDDGSVSDVALSANQSIAILPKLDPEGSWNGERQGEWSQFTFGPLTIIAQHGYHEKLPHRPIIFGMPGMGLYCRNQYSGVQLQNSRPLRKLLSQSTWEAAPHHFRYVAQMPASEKFSLGPGFLGVATPNGLLSGLKRHVFAPLATSKYESFINGMLASLTERQNAHIRGHVSRVDAERAKSKQQQKQSQLVSAPPKQKQIQYQQKSEPLPAPQSRSRADGGSHRGGFRGGGGGGRGGGGRGGQRGRQPPPSYRSS